MPKKRTGDGPVPLTEQNRLYLYQVLADALGCGRQTFLPKAEEALAAVEITPAGLGFETALALFQALDDVVSITTFKGGRYYVTVTRNEGWDKALEQARANKGEGDKADGKPAKGKRDKKRKKPALKPVRPKQLVAVGEQKPESEDAAAEAGQPRAQVEPEAIGPQPEVEAAGKAADATPDSQHDAVVETTACEPEQSIEATTPEAEATPEPTRLTLLEQIEAQLPSEPPVEPAPQPEPQPEGEPSFADIEPEMPAPVEPAALAQSFVTAQPAAVAKPAARRDDFPRSFADEVSIKPALRGLLTRILPIDADLMAVLDEDFRVARATGTASGSRSRLTFPLRYLQEDGSKPVEVTIRRTSRPTDARKWQLVLVDGDDGTGNAHESTGFEGLPQTRLGYWNELSRPGNSEAPSDPARDLAQFMAIGTWEGFLGTVATAAAPEGWNYAGEGVGKQSRYGILRDYLCAALARVRATNGLATSSDGTIAAFDTGLVSPLCEPLYAVLEASGSDIPWRFAGLAEAGSGELGARLTANLETLPQAPSYLESLDDVRPRPGALVIPDYRALLGPDGLSLMPRAWLAQELEGSSAARALATVDASASPADRADALRTLARAIADEPGRFRRLCRALDAAIDLSMRRARQSYRHVAPAYDPIGNRTLLLLPLALVDDTRTDCALALELMPSGSYQASSLLSLDSARSAARVVSTELPSWL